jgi:ssDNA thymidine ADP-ribosyltransferase, DarT
MSKHVRSGLRWSSSEEEHLVGLFQGCFGVSQISRTLERSELAVCKRLEHLGLFDFGEFAQAFEARGIRGFCHFTRLNSVEGIFKSGSILSRKSIDDRGHKCLVNDKDRRDSRLDHVSCSVQYPNLYLLDRFRENFPAEKWVVFQIKAIPELMLHAEFAPMNAASENGKWIQKGFGGFEKLFPAQQGKWERGPNHLSSTPTNLQAEILIKSEITLDNVIGVVVSDLSDAEAMADIRDRIRPGKYMRAAVAPEFFDIDKLEDSVHQGSEIDLTWNTLVKKQ